MHANFWEVIASGMGMVLLVVLGMLFKRTTSIEDKVDGLDVKFNNHLVYSEKASGKFMTKSDCKECLPLINIVERLENIHRSREFSWQTQEKINDSLWREMDGHSHEGLPQGSRVIRMPK